jgi:hypothetical protein
MSLEFLQPITQIAEAAGTLGTFAGRIAAVIPKKKDVKPGVYGYVFHIVEEDSMTFESDVTDHYVEDNTALQDHIALKPEIVRLRGLVAELHNTPPGGVMGALSGATKALGAVSAYVPGLAAGAQRLYNQAEQVVNTVNKVAGKINDVASAFGLASPADNAQTKAFNEFRGRWARRETVTVETPWGVMEDMVIMSITARQDNTTRHVTSFEMTFKKIYIAQTETEAANMLGRAGDASAPPTDSGNLAGTEVDRSTAKTLYDFSRT